VCSEWKGLQKILWAEVRKESGGRKHRFRIRGMLADKGCGGGIGLGLRYRCGKAGSD